MSRSRSVASPPVSIELPISLPRSDPAEGSLFGNPPLAKKGGLIGKCRPLPSLSHTLRFIFSGLDLCQDYLSAFFLFFADFPQSEPCRLALWRTRAGLPSGLAELSGARSSSSLLPAYESHMNLTLLPAYAALQYGDAHGSMDASRHDRRHASGWGEFGPCSRVHCVAGEHVATHCITLADTISFCIGASIACVCLLRCCS